MNTQPPFLASNHTSPNTKHLLLAATGSVATTKIPQILSSLSSFPNLKIHLLLTTPSTHFLPPDLIPSGNLERIWTDTDEWISPGKTYVRDSPVLHIELRRWADLLVIAPLSANTLAKIVGGICDNLLTSVVRAWDFGDGKKKIVVAPAMNTIMWKHPITDVQMGVLRGWEWVRVLEPVEKRLACGDEGVGGMREWGEVVGVIREELGLVEGVQEERAILV